MAKLQELISQIEDPILQECIQQEADKLTESKKFGLVFEEHLPECTPLYGVPVRKGSIVALKTGYVSDIYIVMRIDGDDVQCENKKTHEQKTFKMDEIVVVAEFGEPIYPYLKPVDSVCNAPDSDLWHTLIEADNYHALQLLEYFYPGRVDCIYIDPPYNTGAHDWKYNNDYVDNTDAYRHSKWLSMMEKRLKLAKKLLNPKDSILIVSIDEKEYLHLGCLLEDMFPEAKIQMISSRINATGIIRQNTFTRVDEYIYFVMFGASYPLTDSVVTDDVKSVLWHGLRRRDIESRRGTVKGGTAQFYPIYVNDATCKIEKVGDPLPPEMDKKTVAELVGCTTVFPLRPDGIEMNWGLIGPVLKERIRKGYVRAKRKRGKEKEYTIEYLTSGYIKDIESGKAIIQGYAEDGSVIAKYQSDSAKVQLPTQWDVKAHYSKENGTGLLRKLLGGKVFSFPKSLYAVSDCIRYFVANKPNALIVDFFAGSGTTLHAVNLLNAEDNGHRRCIMVTNNEVSEAEAKSLAKQGFKPGDEEWEQYGIARYVTWPRTVCSIEGHDVNGKPLDGDYGIESEAYEPDDEVQLVNPKTGKPVKKTVYKKVKKQMYPKLAEINKADGFKANAVYFKLGFLDKTSVALGRQFAELLPILWMKAGAIGKCPSLSSDVLSQYLILPDNRFAVLIDETAYSRFIQDMAAYQDMQTVYFVTDSESAYLMMADEFDGMVTYQLYRDYLDNFRINTGRQA